MNTSLGFYAQFRFHECHAFPHGLYTCNWNLSITSSKFTIICTKIIYSSWFPDIALMCIILVAHIPCVTCRLNLIGKISYLFWAIATKCPSRLNVYMQKTLDCLLNTNIHFHRFPFSFMEITKKWWPLFCAESHSNFPLVRDLLFEC